MDIEKLRFGTELIKRGFAKMQKGGVIMDVTNSQQAEVAEQAGAVAVMALHRVPADIRAEGGVARMADPRKIEEIMDAVTIPVMAKCRIGHILEARALEALGVDMVDESEVLTPADVFFHIDKREFVVPFVCGARSLGEAVRRIWEGAAMIRTKGEAGTGNVVEAVRHMRLMNYAIERVNEMDEGEISQLAQKYAMPYRRLADAIKDEGIKIDDDDPIFGKYSLEEIVKGLTEVLKEVKDMGRLPVVNFAAGGIATPADAAFMMMLGSDGVFVGSGIFKSSNPPEYARAMKGQEIDKLEEKLQTRGL